MLRLERKQAPDVSQAVRISSACMMSCAGKPLASCFNNGQTSAGYGGVEAGSPLDRNLLTVRIFAGTPDTLQGEMEWEIVYAGFYHREGVS